MSIYLLRHIVLRHSESVIVFQKTAEISIVNIFCSFIDTFRKQKLYRAEKQDDYE
jgi:hypothetical protein